MTPPFERRIIVTSRDGRVEASLEDYNHHFVVILEHDGAVVTGASLESPRPPWSECSGGEAELVRIVGEPVGVRSNPSEANRFCTHQLDLACMAVRLAGLGLARRTYEVSVTGWDAPEASAEVVRDDGRRLAWTVAGHTVTGPPRYAGQQLGGRFAAWANAELDPDEAEMALVLRRAAWMALSRGMDLDDYATLAETGLPAGVCWATQPERIEHARRNVGTARVHLSPR